MISVLMKVERGCMTRAGRGNRPKRRASPIPRQKPTMFTRTTATPMKVIPIRRLRQSMSTISIVSRVSIKSSAIPAALQARDTRACINAKP